MYRMTITRILNSPPGRWCKIAPSVAIKCLPKSPIGYFRIFLLLFIGFSCSIDASESSVATKNDTPEQLHGSYPAPSSTSIAQNDPVESQSDFWQCGYEIIVVKGPADELIYIKVPLQCDPLADTYKGCFDETTTLKQ